MDDADERRKGQDAARTSALRRAADALDENKARLRRTSAEMRERERELDRTGDLVRDVARSTRELGATQPGWGRAAPATEREAADDESRTDQEGEAAPDDER